MSDQHKYLTEAMGYRYIKTITGGHFGFCVQYEDENGRDFIVMAGVFFFLLLEWAQEQEWWDSLMVATGCGFKAYVSLFGPCGEDRKKGTLPVFLANPNRFTNAVYEFLKERDHEQN